MTHYTLDVLSSFGASVVKFTSLASSEAGFVTLLATEASSTAGSFKISSFAVVLSPLLDSSLTVTLRDSWSGSFNTPWRTSCRAICGGKKFVRYFRSKSVIISASKGCTAWSYWRAEDINGSIDSKTKSNLSYHTNALRLLNHYQQSANIFPLLW